MLKKPISELIPTFKENKKRKNYLDIVKGISIVSIVLLHYEDGFIPQHLNTFIGMFMITAFYFTSGWLSGQSDKNIRVMELIHKRTPTLIKPYIWFSFILIIFDIILVTVNLEEPKMLLIDVYKTIALRGIGTLWFLPALLGGEIIFTYLKNKNIFYKLLGLTVTLVYLWFYNYWTMNFAFEGDIYRVIDVPIRTLKNILLAWIIIASGFYIGKYAGVKIIAFHPIKKIFLIIIFSFMSFYLIVNDSTKISYVVVLDSLILNIMTPMIILLFAMLTENWNFNRFFLFWGRNSLILMATHYTILMKLSVILNTHWTGSSYFGGMNAVYFFIITMLIEYIIVYFINTKASFLIGREQNKYYGEKYEN